MRVPCVRQNNLLLLLLIPVILALVGCAGVKVSSVGSSDYMALRRGDILTTGELSVYTGAALQVFGINKDQCDREETDCRQALIGTGLDNEKRLSALAELWLMKALKLDKQPRDSERVEATINAYLETARYAYAYLFMTKRTPDMRALEDRQAQVRDYYNFAIQQTLTVLFEYYTNRPRTGFDNERDVRLQLGIWSVTIKTEDAMPAHTRKRFKELIPASSLSFAGLRNQYRRDGLGAELVAVTSRRVVNISGTDAPYSETPFPAITAVVSFPGDSLKEVMSTHEVVISGYDPYNRESVELGGKQIPLAANFTSAYGLWLARSGFAAQSLLTLIGKGKVLERPHVYLMQPYNPKRGIVIMLHGLASSPEAWINLANEVMGDETLRQNFQIWQVYYPTNAPIAFNNAEISKAIRQTLRHFDPAGAAEASWNIILVGHSMGGILSRLMVSSSGECLWNAFLERYPLQGYRLERAREELHDYLYFEPLPQVSRVIFIATPHKGTPFAEIAPVRWIAKFITVPFSMLGRFKDFAQLIIDPGSAAPVSLTRPFNSIDNLSSRDPFIQLTADLPISPGVCYHSIIGNNKPKLPLADSSDGVVPYVSSHLDGAASEKVISSGHSVQETHEAIIEIRRIMHLHYRQIRKVLTGARTDAP